MIEFIVKMDIKLTGRILLAIAAAAMAVIAIGCGSTGSAPAPGYFPHADGYGWEYRCRMFEGTVETYSVNETRYIDGTTLLSNGLTAVNFIVSDEVSSASTKYYYINETGVYDYGTALHPTTEADMILALPLEVGRTWFRRGTMTCTAVTRESVTVPAGTFNAVKVEVGGGGSYEWYSDGIGLVKSSVDFIIVSPEGDVMMYGSGTYIKELTSKNF